MSNATTQQLTSLEPRSEVQTEVFVGCASFEDRCLGVLSLLSPKYRFTHSLPVCLRRIQ